MSPGNDVTIASKRDAGMDKGWHGPRRCSVCRSRIWFSPIILREPLGAPEPRQIWSLCKPCHEALLVEMRRSPVRSPTRLRIALGLVASERSPNAYHHSEHIREQRQFTAIMLLIFFFGLLHLILFVVLFAPMK